MKKHIAVCVGECMIELTGSSLGNLATSEAGFGGDTLNTAAYLAACLGDAGTSRYVTALGSDALSHSMVKAWTSLGIDTSGVSHIDGALPGLYAIETASDGERQFHYWRSEAAAKKMASPDRVETLLDSLRDADLVYLSGISLAILPTPDRNALIDALIQFAAQGTRIAFDINYRPALWSPTEALEAVQRLGPAIDIALPSVEDDALMRSQDVPTLDFWRSLGASELVIKQGAQGVVVSNAEHTQTVAPRQLRDAVDTTAAGDSFNAAYLAARLRGESPPAAAVAGHELAGEVVMHRGAIVPALTLSL